MRTEEERGRKGLAGERRRGKKRNEGGWIEKEEEEGIETLDCIYIYVWVKCVPAVSHLMDVSIFFVPLCLYRLYPPLSFLPRSAHVPQPPVPVDAPEFDLH